MRQFWLLLAACALCAAADPEYRARREALAKSLPESVIVVYGQTDAGEENLRTGFFQNATFRYLTGWDAPGAILLLDPKRHTLFVPERNPARERWTGRQPAPGDPAIERISGFDAVLPAATFETELRAALERYPKLYAAGAEAIARLRALSPAPGEVLSADRPLALLRMKKSPRELEQLQRSADASVAAHLAAWKRAAAGVFEYQVAAAALSTYLDLGCERSAYAPIAGSGPNSVFLHYSRNARRMEPGDLLLLDAGAECGGYAGDITRTAPVGGKFTARQREIYEIVLGAEKAAIAVVKPGAYIGGRNRPSLQQAAMDYIDSHGKDLHGAPLGKYFTHGISHHIGLEVHDASDNTAPLEEGMVISVEPGIYIPEENIGIRIEDMVLVTGAGAKVMTAALPREAAEVEKAIRK
jgi:Xaa-Pro aminopeptidase